MAQRLFYSARRQASAPLGRVEELLRPFSFYKSMSHRPVALYRESIFDNRAREAWENPFTGDMSTASFWDLFDEALEKAEENIDASDRDGFDLAAARAITNERDFSGEPAVATLVSVTVERTAQRARRRTQRAAATRPPNTPAPRGAKRAMLKSSSPSFWLELAAALTGGLSGAMSAVRARYDIFGVACIAIITGLAGGIMRDLLMQNYGIYAFQKPTLIIACAGAGVVVFYFGKLATYLDPIVDLLDNLSVALWAVISVGKSLSAGSTSCRPSSWAP